MTTTGLATPSYRSAARTALILLPFALGYFLSYLFRAVNAVVAPNLVSELGLTASQLGLLTAAYLLAFALFQLPLGVALDRYGPRRVQIVLLSCAALGALAFSLGESVTTLAVARALIGLGFAGGLMSGFKAVVLWVPEPRRALANSLVMSLGALGLMVATAPMELAVQAFGWRQAFLGLVAVTAVVALLIVVAVPERGNIAKPLPIAQQFSQIGGIYRDRAFLALAPLLAATAGTHIAIQTLWAGPWLRDVAGYDRSGVANALFLMAGAFFIGILGTGAVADWFTRRRAGVLTVMLAFIGMFIAAQSLIVFAPPAIAMPAWLLFGSLGQVAILAYPWLSSHFGGALSGRANTAMNLVIFAAAFVIQSAIGALIDQYPRTAAGGYPPEAYRWAFGVFLGLQVAMLGWYFARRSAFERPGS
jgi:predicted MFS family arabinose efflux permease